MPVLTKTAPARDNLPDDNIIQGGMIPRWMTLKVAAFYSSIGQKRLKALAKSGRVFGYPDHDDGRKGWIFDRFSIDEYRSRKSTRAASKVRALEILRQVK